MTSEIFLMKHVRALIAVVLSLFAVVSHACSCIQISDTQKFRNAEVVVVGVVLETRYVEDKTVLGGGYVRAKLAISEVLKGKVTTALTVNDQIAETGMCSSNLRAGVEFVLFVDDRHEVGMCSGTRQLGGTVYDRGNNLMELRKLKAAATQGL
ncbi:MAG: hypothetical protein KKB95_22725 [Gammaproteobacteria bacterium]|nr:hypothetical protein [Gammaproteobacteria bacterium]MBU1506552.1 hypothetical protein [Gammaproteobacteria bacterium]MBU2121518.1 hypothetical protein [Gammaproteobacteria bacterium]MBU2170460.1 hypothetical protein [Gammaproteobacteria bacterium]MBU2199579.1 hypothetical protein [Gammaproteobacteria bacterium]